MSDAPKQNTNPLGLVMRDEAAAQLGVSVSMLRKFVRLGKLRPVRYSKTAPLRFREADLRRFIDAHTCQPQPQAPKGGNQ